MSTIQATSSTIRIRAPSPTPLFAAPIRASPRRANAASEPRVAAMSAQDLLLRRADRARCMACHRLLRHQFRRTWCVSSLLSQPRFRKDAEPVPPVRPVPSSLAHRERLLWARVTLSAAAPLAAVGWFPTESITEDFLLSLKLTASGAHSSHLRHPDCSARGSHRALASAPRLLPLPPLISMASHLISSHLISSRWHPVSQLYHHPPSSSLHHLPSHLHHTASPISTPPLVFHLHQCPLLS